MTCLSYIVHLENRVQDLENHLRTGASQDSPDTHARVDIGRVSRDPAPAPAGPVTGNLPTNNTFTPAIDKTRKHGSQRREGSPSADDRHSSKRARLQSPQEAAHAVSETAFTTESPHIYSVPAGGGSSSVRLPSFARAIPGVRPAQLPDRTVAHELVEPYFQRSNCQFPILDQTEFMELFDRIFAGGTVAHAPGDLFVLNIVLAMGKRLQISSQLCNPTSRLHTSDHNSSGEGAEGPENYYNAAVNHLEFYLSASTSRCDNLVPLMELRAVLLICALALMMPIASGIWYTVSIAVRLAVDLGLYREDAEVSHGRSSSIPYSSESITNLKRRLWWCVYSLDRMICTCTERPFSIADEVINTRFPSLLASSGISGTVTQRPAFRVGSRLVAQHYFEYRRLQSEILQVVQNREIRNAFDRNDPNESSAPPRPPISSFLLSASTYEEWRSTMAQKLQDWRASAPMAQDTGVESATEFFDMNYWQAIMMLFRPSMELPNMLKQKLGTTHKIICRGQGHAGQQDEEAVFLTLADAGQHILRLYRRLQRRRLLSYPYLATHHLFLSAIVLLYSFWHSPAIRRTTSVEELDFLMLGACSVLDTLTHLCPPAEHCSEILGTMSRNTLEMRFPDSSEFPASPALFSDYHEMAFTKSGDEDDLKKQHHAVIPVNNDGHVSPGHSRPPSGFAGDESQDGILRPLDLSTTQEQDQDQDQGFNWEDHDYLHFDLGENYPSLVEPFEEFYFGLD
ncbi:fungal-specific transcription factor domain-containing protein [Exophiala viscosa]|uniref:Fungal-specific transcription factor domain-containing protein n=1 Tax=Exophiala viscosa TaxID=2486360 RepID=A0AAN6DVS5_9EURO|nr:fungal-specific transcription factor domain-containing protein [Exophiala viscosa]KAI1625579.1 fungal-specific transcription factor domain-containing protein [Exophiala viscosa]